MANSRYEDVLLNHELNPVPNAQVTVFLAGTNTLAALFAGDDTPISNPVTTDDAGAFSFYAVGGSYDLKASGGNPPITPSTIGIWLPDQGGGGGGATPPGGLTSQIQYNSSGVFAGSPELVWDTDHAISPNVTTLAVGSIDPFGARYTDCRVLVGDSLTAPARYASCQATTTVNGSGDFTSGTYSSYAQALTFSGSANHGEAFIVDLNFSHQATGTFTGVYGLYSSMLTNPDAGAGSVLIAVHGECGALSDVSFIRAGSFKWSAGGTSDSAGGVEIVNLVNGTVTTAYGININSLYNTGTVGTYYGIFIGDCTGEPNHPSAAWSIYSNGGKSFFKDQVVLGTESGPSVRAGAGSPEGAVAAPVGSLYTRTDGGANTTLYVKEIGTGNTGWVATGGAAIQIAETPTANQALLNFNYDTTANVTKPIENPSGGIVSLHYPVLQSNGSYPNNTNDNKIVFFGQAITSTGYQDVTLSMADAFFSIASYNVVSCVSQQNPGLNVGRSYLISKLSESSFRVTQVISNISNVVVSADELTVTFDDNGYPQYGLQKGMLLTFTAMTNATFLTNQTVTITSVDDTAHTFTAAFTHADYSAAEFGTSYAAFQGIFFGLAVGVPYSPG